MARALTFVMHEPGLFEHLQMLRYGRAADGKSGRELPTGLGPLRSRSKIGAGWGRPGPIKDFHKPWNVECRAVVTPPWPVPQPAPMSSS